MFKTTMHHPHKASTLTVVSHLNPPLYVCIHPITVTCYFVTC